MKELSFRKAIWFAVIIYAVGLAGHSYEPVRRWFVYLSGGALVLYAVVMLYNDLLVRRSTRFALWCAVALVVSFSVEAAGVATGKIFGFYTYTDVLGVRIAGVPPVIAVNWITVILGSASVAGIIVNNRYLQPLVAAVICAVFDMVLEPFAVGMGYWIWKGDIPVQNYAVWALLTFAAVTMLLLMRCDFDRKLAGTLFSIQAVYIVMMNVILVI